MDQLALESFLAVASTKSFTKAAIKISRTQSAVSQQIAKLEEVLGKQLIDRKNGFALTDEGEIFQEYAQKIVAMQLEVVDRFKTPGLEGQVSFGLPEDFATFFLTDVLIEFARAHPKMRLKIDCDLTLNLYERFKKNEFDLVLLKMSKPEDLPNGLEVLSEQLNWVGDEKLVSEALKTGKPIPLVLSPQPCVYRSSVIKALEEKSLNWQVTFSSPSYNGTIAALKAGLGISILPKSIVPKKLKTIKNTTLPVLPDTHISLLRQAKPNAAISFFEEFILKKLKS